MVWQVARHYRPRPLNRLTIVPSAYQQKEHISFAYRVFNLEDCLNYLDRDVIAKGYQPVNITFTNNSNKFLYISKTNFSFPCASSCDVAQKVHTSTVKRAVGYGVAGLFIWPFLIPAIVDGIGSSEANQKLDVDFRHKSLHNQMVSPYSTVSGLIFVPIENFNSEFSLTLIETESHSRFTLTTEAPILGL